MRDVKRYLYSLSRVMTASVICLLVTACANIGSPDGGWYDERPPQIVKATPAEGAINVNTKKIRIDFNEFINIENVTEKVVVSPPQKEAPEIKATRKSVKIELVDSLIPNTTYTIDFSDAIFDNNENNPLGNYTYSFSTGDVIDSLEVSGTVLDAQTLTPVQGILVGLHNDLSDTAFTKKPLVRVARTNEEGKFIVRGIAPGKYKAYALKDMDGDYAFSQKGEMIAFSDREIVPTSKPDVRQDTTWIDSLHIKSIESVPYTHFLPDDIVLLAFTEEQTERHFLKSSREDERKIEVFFSYGSDSLPEIQGLDFDSSDAFIVEASEHKDTIVYWIKDTTLVNRDTLTLQMRYLDTDTTGQLVSRTDTLEVLPKTSYEKRMKKKAEEYEKWFKQQEKKKKKEEPYDSIMPVTPLEIKTENLGKKDPDTDIRLIFPTPLDSVKTEGIHLYCKIDTQWYNAPFMLEKSKTQFRTYEVIADWQPGVDYSFECDSAAFVDIYGLCSPAIREGIKVNTLDQYSSLIIKLQNAPENLIVYLLDKSGKVVKSAKAKNNLAEFYYLKGGSYFVSALEDTNGNGKWDTGLYEEHRNAENVFFMNRPIECKEKWDVTETWNVRGTEITLQRPKDMKSSQKSSSKSSSKKTVQKGRNLKRAAELGIEYDPEKDGI